MPKKTAFKKGRRSAPKRPTGRLDAVVADVHGQIFELADYAAVGMAGETQQPLATPETVPIPYGSELMMLPDRRPIVWHRQRKELQVLTRNPYAPDEPIFPVAAFNSPGYVISATSAYQETQQANPLPLFSYGAVGWKNGGFHTAAQQVDREPRQDLRQMPIEKVKAGVHLLQKELSGNRLLAHLQNCALNYGCPAGKNFFLGRYEAPLPVSQSCNAKCLGCLSLQPEGPISCSQHRIDFTPTATEIRQIALAHISRVPKAVVSFGQGCEGDPLLAADVIAAAIAEIRQHTHRGTIHMNSNASRPQALARLFDAGLDSLRVSINSLRPACYGAYFRPNGYRFEDVIKSVRLALDRGIHVSLNYLNLPGFTDSRQELATLERFLTRYPVAMIQWRNLNYDPMRYWQAMQAVSPSSDGIGIRRMLNRLHSQFPQLVFGYFNPPREKWNRRGKKQMT